MSSRPTADDFLRIGPNVRVLPIIHGSGDFAIRVREELLARSYDCLAVPLPPSFQDDVEAAIERLPAISVVAQLDADPDDAEHGFSYVPIDPCQGVIAALRVAIGERIAREFIDMETPRFEAQTRRLPRPLRPEAGQPRGVRRGRPAGDPAARARPARATGSSAMAARLRALEVALSLDPLRLLAARLALDPRRLQPRGSRPRSPSRSSPRSRPSPSIPQTLLFVLGELPFLTGLYERGRRELTPDDNLSVDGVKEMVLQARDRLRAKLPKVAQRITPQLLSVYFRYVRNLSLIERRLTPDLYTLVVAAKQTAGDDFALAVAETAREYPFAEVEGPSDPDARAGASESILRMGIDRAEVPGWGTARMVSRLPGQALSWRTLRAEAAASRARPDASGSSAGTRSACAPGPPRTTGSRASTATSATRPRRSSAPTWRARRSSRPAFRTASTSARRCGTGTPATST